MVQVICTMEVIQNEEIALRAAMISTELWYYGYHLMYCMHYKGSA